MKAAIYCRLSKEDEDHEHESESIQNQKSMLVKYAIDRGFEIYNIYCDEDYSGIDRSRPDFNRMIEAASQHKFDIILAKTQSRFTRDMELVEKYLHGKFVEWGIRFIAVVDHVDTDDAANKKSRQINGLINEWYLEDLSVNVRSVLSHKVREGQYIASFALYGYRKDPENKNHLLIDEEAAEVVRKIYALYLAGNGCGKIAQILNEEGVPTPTVYKHQHGVHYHDAIRYKDCDLWSKATIYRMLSNRTYVGDLEQGRHKKVSYKSEKTIWLPKSEWVVVPNTHEGIIGRDTFELVQEMAAMRVRGGTDGTIHPLSGKVRCSKCGSVMELTGGGYRKSASYKRYMRCRMHQRYKERCSGQDYMPLQVLEEFVLRRIQEYVSAWFDPGKVDTALPETGAAKRLQAKQKELHRLQSEVERRNKAIKDLYLDKSGGLLDAEQFIEISQAYHDEIKSMKARMASLACEIDEIGDLNGQKQKVAEKLRDIASVNALTRELVALLVDSIVVYPIDPAEKTRRVEINWKF